MIELLIQLALILFLVIAYILVGLYFNYIRKDKVLSAFTWIIFMGVIGGYTQTFSITALTDWSDLWCIFAFSYLFIFEAPDWINS